MTEVLIEKHRKTISLDKLDKTVSEKMEKELLKIFRLSPPPQDGICECCGKHNIELKRFRTDGSYIEETAMAVRRAERCCGKDGFSGPLDWLIDRYGKEEGERLYCTDMANHIIIVSWECRDCAALNDSEYHQKCRRRRES